jgi:hypothetical protein
MEPEGLFPVQNSLTYSYPEPHESKIGPPIQLLKIEFNIILPCISRSSRLILSYS